MNEALSLLPSMKALSSTFSTKFWMIRMKNAEFSPQAASAGILLTGDGAEVGKALG